MQNLEDQPQAKTLRPIVEPAGRSFWVEAIKGILAFLAAQLIIAFGLPVDDAAAWLMRLLGFEANSATAWWIAATAVTAMLYIVSRSLPRAQVANAA